MRFSPTELADAYTVELERHEDERGFFARIWCNDELSDHGLVSHLSQCSISRNSLAGTLRGMHLNIAGHEEAKLVRCTRGAIHDVIVDVRPDSPTYLTWLGIDLDADNGRALFVPGGCAHGFLTLEHRSDVAYQMSRAYEPGVAIGYRWNDPAFGIEWPRGPTVIAERDATYPDFGPQAINQL